MSKNSWFEVDKNGLGKLLQRRGKSFIIFEVIQNGWDQNVTFVDATFEKEQSRPYATLTVKDDDPEGFADLTHAFTLFAESVKKKDPTKRGRFNLGEKLVLACCEEAEILTTTGGVKFNKNGSRSNLRRKTIKGSIFKAIIRVTREEYEEICDSVDRLLVPENIRTTFNGRELEPRKAIERFTETLPTEISGEDGELKRTSRKTEVRIHKIRAGETAHIYEMGIPVVETGDTFHVDVQQKVPLNMERDNVTPAYLKKLRTFVMNHTFDLLDKESVNETWVKQALESEDCSEEAVNKSLDLRFGKKRVVYDPSDPEANKAALNKGYTVIHGGSLSSREWGNVRKTGTTKPAGQVLPSGIKTSPNGVPPIPWEKMTDEQKKVVVFIERLAKPLIGSDVRVEIFNLPEKARAWYGNHRMSLNLRRLGRAFFTNFPENIQEVLNITIHELAHEYEDDHYTEQYNSAVTLIGATMTVFALRRPELFDISTLDIERRETCEVL